jgi:hypothetical protein
MLLVFVAVMFAIALASIGAATFLIVRRQTDSARATALGVLALACVAIVQLARSL